MVEVEVEMVNFKMVEAEAEVEAENFKMVEAVVETAVFK